MTTDHEEIRCLETILDYQMTTAEARAYKICCIYIDTLRALFPNESRYGHGKGDPRKKYLFKVCYTLIRETQHKLKDQDYPLYVRAQLDIIKYNTTKSGRIPNVSPTCLVGEKAWVRWEVWKKLLDKKRKQALTAEEKGVDIHTAEKVKIRLDDDLNVLKQRLNPLDDKSIEQAVNSRTLLRWIAIGQISPYYALLSPHLNKWLETQKLQLDDLFRIDFNMYRKGIDAQIEEYFRDTHRYGL